MWVVACVALAGCALAIYMIVSTGSAAPILPSQLLNFLGIVIGAVALVATVGFLVLAFPIWSELGAIAEERKEIAQDRRETLKLRDRVEGMMRDLNSEAVVLREKVDDTVAVLSAPYSRYTGIYDSLKLFSTVIRYIGTPLWEEDDGGKGDSAEPEAERVDRHVSLVQQLMAAMAVEPDHDLALYLSFMRDAVGHLRSTDDKIFFEFVDTRLKAARPVEPSHKEVLQQIWDRFEIVRGHAAHWRRSQDPRTFDPNASTTNS